jgi:hypothetical protein
MPEPKLELWEDPLHLLFTLCVRDVGRTPGSAADAPVGAERIDGRTRGADADEGVRPTVDGRYHKKI